MTFLKTSVDLFREIFFLKFLADAFASVFNFPNTYVDDVFSKKEVNGICIFDVFSEILVSISHFEKK